MPKRVAFLIGNQTFRPDSGLLPLQGPANDLKAFARLLSDPERGRFEVNEFLDKPNHEVLPEIEQALSAAAPSELFLIYYSGHGKLDRNGRLCLATANTRQGALLATSIPARHLGDLVEHSDCDQVVLLLDCCYSGAVGLRGDVESELRVVENARGFYIMTASSDMQAAREEQPAAGGAVMGRFTAALVSGIESGAADRERKGKVLLSDLRRHLEQVVTGQTPKFFARNASGDPLISLSVGTAAPLIDAEVLADLDAAQWHRRRGAVSALVGVLRHDNAEARAAAKVILQRRLVEERDFIVRAELESALGIESVNAPSVPRPAAPPSETSTPSVTKNAAPATDSAKAPNRPKLTPTRLSDAKKLLSKGQVGDPLIELSPAGGAALLNPGTSAIAADVRSQYLENIQTERFRLIQDINKRLEFIKVNFERLRSDLPHDLEIVGGETKELTEVFQMLRLNRAVVGEDFHRAFQQKYDQACLLWRKDIDWGQEMLQWDKVSTEIQELLKQLLSH